MAKNTKTLMIFDLIANKEVMNIRLHAESESEDKYVIASVWKNKNYNFSQFRMENLGRTLLDYQEGRKVLLASFQPEITFWNARVAATQLELITV